MCLMKESKYEQAARCIRSGIMTKVIDSVVSLDTFEQQSGVLKGMLQSPRLKYHVKTIGIDPPLRNNSKIFLRLLWFLLMKDSPTSVLCLPGHHRHPRNQVLKNHCVCLLTFKMWKKTAYCRVGVSKSKRKAIKFGNTPWSLKQKWKGYSKISEHINKSLYNWIMNNLQVVQPPIANNFLKVRIYGYTEPQLFPKSLLQVSVR